MSEFADLILAQEAQGQKTLVKSTHLPKKGDWEALSLMGVQRGLDVDDLFCEAILPSGWQKIPTDHSMWTNLVDERGTPRVAIFYKATFYDRDAFFSFSDV